MENLKLHCVFITLLFLSQRTVQQHIFDTTCTYSITNSTETITFASQVLHIENKRYDVYINFCSGLSGIADCDAKSKACITKKKGKTKFIPNAATTFSSTIETDGTKNLLLTATNSATCDDGAYEFKIILDKSVDSNRITTSETCEMEITIPHPDVAIRDCGYAYKGLIMDMKPLKQVAEVSIHIDNMQIPIAACRPAPSCSNQSSICEISNKNIFSVAESQHFVYDERSNVLTLRGRQPRDKIKSEVKINCNWTATFDHPVKQAAKYKYVIDSKYGCVKMPLDCQLQDMEYYAYDLSSLNKPTGWRVGNITAGIVLINVCGTLKLKTSETACSDTYSQVCYQNGNKYLSYGSLHQGLHFDGDNIRLTYTHGSQCTYNKNITKYATTDITFVCARNDYGPMLTSNINCTMHIEWKTPKACPTHIAEESTFGYNYLKNQFDRVTTLPCSVHDENGQLYDLRTLIPKTPLSFASSKTGFKYFINICRPVQLTKENYLCKITGACIEDTSEINIKKRFTWVGSIANPRIENKELVIHYNGGYCANAISGVREVIIHFVCAKNLGTLKLSNETNCRTDFQWETPLACDRKTKRSTDCLINSSRNEWFDFNRIRNQMFQVAYRNTSYYFDMCRNSVVLSTNGTIGKNATFVGTRQLQYNISNCQYSLLYTLSNETCRSLSVESLISLRVDLLCDDIIFNADHIGNYSIDGCNASITLKTNAVCAKLHSECPQRQEHQEEAQPAAVIAPTCKVLPDKYEFIIHSIKELHLNHEKNNYSINGKCTGYICKNNHTIATLEACPNRSNVIIVDNEKQMVEMNLIGPVCQNDVYKVKIELRCSTKPHAEISLSSECMTNFLIHGNETCPLFVEQVQLPEKPKDISVAGLIIGIILLCIAIIVIVCITWKKYGFSYRCLSRNQHAMIPNKLYERNVDD